jgi:hypothetical protein
MTTYARMTGMPYEAWMLNLLLVSFHSTEKRFERKVNPHLSILQHLAKNTAQFWAFPFPLSQQPVRFKQRRAFLLFFPRVVFL